MAPCSPIAISLVVPSTHVVHDFECAICNNLVEEPSYTSCAHVFCGACLEEWLVASQERTGEEPRCPSCQTGLGRSDSYSPLRVANPLAWRILSRVQCRCPLSASASGCQWVGDYSEVHAHLTKSSYHEGDGQVAQTSNEGRRGTGGKAYADALKAQGNAKFEARAFREAAEIYSKALAASPADAALLCNRAAAHLMLDQLDETITDCRAALLLRPDYPKAHLRLAEALCRQGKLKEAESQLSRAIGQAASASAAVAADRDPPSDSSHGSDPEKAEMRQAHARLVQVGEGLEAAEAALASGNILEAQSVMRELESLDLHVHMQHVTLLMSARIHLAAGWVLSELTPQPLNLHALRPRPSTQTPNPKASTRNPKPETLNPHPKPSVMVCAVV